MISDISCQIVKKCRIISDNVGYQIFQIFGASLEIRNIYLIQTTYSMYNLYVDIYKYIPVHTNYTYYKLLKLTKYYL